MEFLSGGGQMGHVIAETDWSHHPMGPIAGWTLACRTAMSLVLNSGFPSYILWGPDFFLFYNDAYAPILGAKIAMGQGRRLAEVWSEVGEEAVGIAKAAYAGEVHFFKDRPFVLERYGQPKQAFFTFSLSPIRDRNGGIAGVLCIIVETTDNVISTAKLRESEDRLQLSLDASGNIGTWSWYPDTNETFVDERFARLFQVDAALAQSGTQLERFTNMIHPDDRDRVLAAIAHAIATGELYEIDYRIPQLSGHIIWVTAKGKLLADPPGGIKRFAGVAVDITEHRRKHDELMRLAAELGAAHGRQSEFLATLSHELRNPLAPIRMGLELMRLNPADPPTLERLRGMMERQVNQLTHLIDDLMDLARINNGKVELQAGRMDLRAAVRSAAETSQPHIEQARHHLATTLAEQPLMVEGDPTRLAQVLSNILTNAAKYTPAGGHIAIRAWRENKQGVVAISDTGVGIPAAALSGIFDMFSQVRSDIAGPQGGLGIGLALVKRLVELHGGTVVADSPGAGKGATFTVRLPLIEDGARGHTMAPAPAPAARTGAASHRVLVADDNIDAAETLAAILRLRGHVVQVAADGDQALLAARAITPDVAFLDLGMPGKDGLALARDIRSAPELAGMVLVALTGWGSAADRALSSEAGFNYHLTKPASVDDIDHILATIAAHAAG